MDRAGRLKLLAAIVLISGLLLLLGGVPAMAAEGSGNWRPTYDLIMRWINFGILAFLLVHYGRKPLMDFLRGQTDQVAKEIKDVESQKRQIEEKIKETQDHIEQSTSRFEKIKARIIEEGERARREIIEDAKQQSRKLLEMESRKAASRILTARQNFLAEMVDSATRHAQERLPDMLTEDDHRKYLDLYLSSVNRMAG